MELILADQAKTATGKKRKKNPIYRENHPTPIILKGPGRGAQPKGAAKVWPPRGTMNY